MDSVRGLNRNEEGGLNILRGLNRNEEGGVDRFQGQPFALRPLNLTELRCVIISQYVIMTSQSNRGSS